MYKGQEGPFSTEMVADFRKTELQSLFVFLPYSATDVFFYVLHKLLLQLAIDIFLLLSWASQSHLDVNTLSCEPISHCGNFRHKIEFRICKQFDSTGPRGSVGGGGATI